jgi:glyoxylase-like metal-dependent hydrolase (beta-lactamase superfamily II)
VTGAAGSDLRFELIVSDAIPLALADRLPNGAARTWAPLTSTLLVSVTDAVLIDPPLTTPQADAVEQRIRLLGKHLTWIIITHAHGDHWFTASRIADRLGATGVAATPSVIEAMPRTNASRELFWDRILPGQIPASPITATKPPVAGINIEGHRIELVEVGHSDTDDTTVVHVPDLDLVVAGDVVYDEAHLFLVESAGGGRDAWRAALDRISALDPAHLVAGHATRTDSASPRRLIEQTHRYLDDVDELLPLHDTPAGFFTAMLQRHPSRANPSTLWGSATALYAASRN